MGLLDKADGMQGGSAPKAKPKVAAKKPASQKARPVKAKPVKAKPIKAAKPARQKKARGQRQAPNRELPGEFMLASTGNRAAAGFVNFFWNWSAFITGIALNVFAGSNATWIIIGGLLMAIVNIVIVPGKWGRSIGQFASRTKYIKYTGKKPFFLHGILSNLDVLFIAAGLFFAVAKSNIGTTGDAELNAVNLIIGILCLSIPVANYFFKKKSESKQSLWDFAFGAYLVAHVPTGEETGWAARLENLGEYYEKRQSDKSDKQSKKAKKAKASKAKVKSESKDE
ncbi:MAG: hypothetical protein HOE92_01170 [Euryarchaeota archaeon]|jgi:uncharacterized membrane protein|nr:hypothetical protein [Euryarchaeota archaeon]MBT3970807.1 hypothetical protein [Euryarchaeota archaeon]